VTPVPASSRVGSIVQFIRYQSILPELPENILRSDRYRLAPIFDYLVGVHEGALEKSAASRFQKVGGKVLWQVP